MDQRKPVGHITRGTTGYNRLRRCDRWSIANPQVRSALRRTPLALDVGYGASWTTTVDMAHWLRRVRPDVRVIGLEIDPDRIQAPRDGVTFELGGFELAGYRPGYVRAFNVLRQYDATDVPAAWDMVCSRLAPGGQFIEGTCDEIGRRACWIRLDDTGPQTFTLCWDPFHSERPSDLAERLPKILIHRNLPGEAIHDFLQRADHAWDTAAGWAPYGPRVRWRHAVETLAAEGVPVRPQRRPLRDNQITVPWSFVAPSR
ncbi:class I SAM-dependent methyltransferase [Corynebacterium renale]|uniref:class I SAM-dependent methyltransferase n=1 Tax=Corynebacterium renale TaxID=1724 RepID=UPI000E033EFE|nr:class I SAM-dependent methyltransferase [Corynebacterium renale]STD02834.1 Uncharacterised protein [Corynebacterium renale]